MAELLLGLIFGAIIGLSLGAIGGGGSILTVPVLVSVFSLDPRSAITTSLAVVGATALVGAVPHWRRGRVMVRTALFFGTLGIAGAFAGAWLNHRVPSWLVLTLFGGLMLLVAIRMLTGAGSLRVEDEEKGNGRESRGRLVAAGLIVGLMTGFFGVGGGFLIVPALVLILRLPIHIAVGTSLLVIAVNSFSGLAAYILSGSLDAGLTLAFFAGGVGGTFAGAALAWRISGPGLQKGFAAFILLIGVWMVASNLPF